MNPCFHEKTRAILFLYEILHSKQMEWIRMMMMMMMQAQEQVVYMMDLSSFGRDHGQGMCI